MNRILFLRSLWAVAILIAMSSPAAALFDRYKPTKIYGKVSGYTIGFSDNGICMALRTINIRDRDGIATRGGSFGFGVAEFNGRYVTLISFMNPHWNLQRGQTMPGKIDIDGTISNTVYFADGPSIVSATLAESRLRKIAFGREIRLTGPKRAYGFRLKGIVGTLPHLLQCIRESLKAGDRPKRLYRGTPPALP